MTPDDLMRIVNAHAAWLDRKAGGTCANLARQDLSGVSLPGVVLRQAKLSGVIFEYADLRRADLRRADLFAANLHQALLSGARLSGADLRGVRLRDADLTGADLEGADLREGTLTPAGCRSTTRRCATPI